MRLRSTGWRSLTLGVLGLAAAGVGAEGLVPADLHKLRSVGEVQYAPDGKRVAYTVMNADKPGKPYPKTWIMDLATRESKPFAGFSPRWSPDGAWIAFVEARGDIESLTISRPDGSGSTSLAPVSGTNHPLPSSTESLAWSPDGKQVAFISSTPGPEEDANGDPMVITRYLYKPTATEGLTRFNDNRRIHIFVADVASKHVRQLTSGNYYEHSISWSPDGREILFISNRAEDPDRFFNYDVFAVNVSSGSIRRVTDTKNAEYAPVWSPNGKQIAYLGTTRPLTSSETTMEDTHVWLMNSDGTNRRDVGKALDNRQSDPQWSLDGKFVYFSAQDSGNHHVYRVAASGGKPELVVGGRGAVRSWSLGKGGSVAYAHATPAGPAELYLRTGASKNATRQLTTLNKELLDAKTIAEVEALDFKSFDGTPVQAYLTKPLQVRADSRHPMIVVIHGGPHGADGPTFNGHAQIYANHGYASLMVNYRGSTGYGQKLADAIFKDQNGAEAKDVLAGVDAAIARYPWIDPERLGIEGVSYGGQLTDWIITQTTRFKAAIPVAGISNLVSFNYMSYYHDYLAVEFGSFPHENGLMDLLWERSPLRYVDKVKTPVLFMHGENDNDVPIAEAEQYFIALKDVGVETIMIRYPREGHGVREVAHTVDVAERSMAWYDKHFGSR